MSSEGVITLGIGGTPPDLTWFVTSGLNVGAAAAVSILLASLHSNISPTASSLANISPTFSGNSNISPAAGLDSNISPTTNADSNPSPTKGLNSG